MKKNILFLVLAFCLTMIGCGNRDAEIDSFLTEWNAVTKEIVQKVNDGDLDGARTTFDAKKESLRSKLASIQAAKESEFSDDAKKRFDESFTRNQALLMNLYLKNWTKLAADKDKADKLKALITEYGQVFKMYRVG